MSLRAGAAVRDISPRRPMFLVGYPHVPRTSTAINDPLLASALCLDDGRQSLLLISVDVLFISSETARACRKDIQRATGVPVQNILISATHTHSAPVTAAMLAWQNDPVVPPLDLQYLGEVCQGILGAATAAHATRVPARIAVARGRAPGVGGNRLSPTGTMDPEIGLLGVRRERDGQLVAVDLVYGMHPTVLHEDSTLVSADFPGFARTQITERAPGAIVVYHTGPCGNLSPRYHVRGQTFTEAERLGRALGAAAFDAMAALADADYSDDVVLGAAHTLVNLPPREFPSLPEAETLRQQAVETYQRLQPSGADRGAIRTAECAVFGAEEAVTLSRAQASGALARWRARLMPAEVQVLRVGDAFLVGLPGELFVEYGLEIKRRAPGPCSVISLANGELQGYIVTPETEAAGGYEAAFSVFRAGSGAILVDTAVRLMEQFT